MPSDSRTHLPRTQEPVDILAEYDHRESELRAQVAYLEETILRLTHQLQAKTLLIEEMQGRMQRADREPWRPSPHTTPGFPRSRAETLHVHLSRSLRSTRLAVGDASHDVSRWLTTHGGALVHRITRLTRAAARCNVAAAAALWPRRGAALVPRLARGLRCGLIRLAGLAAELPRRVTHGYRPPSMPRRFRAFSLRLPRVPRVACMQRVLKRKPDRSVLRRPLLWRHPTIERVWADLAPHLGRAGDPGHALDGSPPIPL